MSNSICSQNNTKCDKPMAYACPSAVVETRFCVGGTCSVTGGNGRGDFTWQTVKILLTSYHQFTVCHQNYQVRWGMSVRETSFWFSRCRHYLYKPTDLFSCCVCRKFSICLYSCSRTNFFFNVRVNTSGRQQLTARRRSWSPTPFVMVALSNKNRRKR